MSDVIIGRHEGRYLMARGQQFILIAAPTGSNKGVAIILPNLLNYDGSVVVFDLKLENFKLTSKYRETHGHTCFLFAPFAEDSTTHCWNMLDTISRDQTFRIGDVLAIGQVFYPSDCDPKEKFWNDNARNLFLAFVLYLMETPTLPCTLGEVFRQSSGRGSPLKDHIQAILTSRADSDTPLSDECIDAFSRFLSSPENTLGNIISTFNAPLLIFANPIVDAATSRSDFDLHDLRKKRISLYVGIQPGRLGDAALLVNMLFSRLIELNTKELPEFSPELKHECMLILDELAALGNVKILPKAISFIRGYGIRVMTSIQSIAQLELLYGAADMRTLLTNHAVQILYPPKEQKDATDYSEVLGYLTQKVTTTGTSTQRGSSGGSISENTSEQRRALMLPQELREMPQHRQIIISENCKPILCDKARYYEDHRFLDRLKETSPALARLDRSPPRRFLTALGLRTMAKAYPTEAQIKHAAFVLKELSAYVPTIDIGLHRARTDGRTRPLRPDEGIDVGRLAIDLDALPAFDHPDCPSAASVSAVVDQFFSQLDWVGAKAANPAATNDVTDDTAEANSDNTDNAQSVDVCERPVRAGTPFSQSEANVPPAAPLPRRAQLDLSLLDGDNAVPTRRTQHE